MLLMVIFLQGRSIKLWLRCADSSNHLNIIDQACDADNAALMPSALEVLEFALDALKGSFICASSRIPISQLRRLYRVLPDSEVGAPQLTDRRCQRSVGGAFVSAREEFWESAFRCRSGAVNSRRSCGRRSG